MANKARMIVEFRIEFKKALDLIIANKKSEYEIISLIQLFRDFNQGVYYSEKTEKVPNRPGAYIHIEATSANRCRRDLEDDPDTTQLLSDTTPTHQNTK